MATIMAFIKTKLRAARATTKAFIKRHPVPTYFALVFDRAAIGEGLPINGVTEGHSR